MECWASIFNLTFGTPRTAELLVVPSRRNLPRRKVLDSRFCQMPSGNHGYRIRTEGTGHLKVSKELLVMVLWLSASTKDFTPNLLFI